MEGRQRQKTFNSKGGRQVGETESIRHFSKASLKSIS